jgi:biotin carboxyl carrier protein
MKYVTTIKDKTYIIEINDDERITVDGVEYAVDFESVVGQPVYSLLINGRSYEAYVSENEDTDDWQVLIRGDLFTAVVEDEREKRLRAAAGAGTTASGEYHLKAPMPGLIVAVLVSEGQVVHKGDLLVILESMKMQNELKCPREGTITRIKVKVGDNVEHNQILVTLS